MGGSRRRQLFLVGVSSFVGGLVISQILCSNSGFQSTLAAVSVSQSPLLNERAVYHLSGEVSENSSVAQSITKTSPKVEVAENQTQTRVVADVTKSIHAKVEAAENQNKPHVVTDVTNSIKTGKKVEVSENQPKSHGVTNMSNSDSTRANELVTVPVKNKPTGTKPHSIGQMQETPYNVKHAIFYNMYIPAVGEGVKRKISKGHSMSILDEQITQISNNYVGTQNVTVYVSTIRTDLEPGMLNQVCKNKTMGKVRCVHSAFYRTGGELDTLRNLYTFCQKASGDVRVVYMHNKGSFHPNQKNNWWRRAMTDAVTSKLCLDPPNSTCNLCGLQFATPPTMFTMLMPGNFFAATCGYVKKLMHPDRFRSEIEKVKWHVYDRVKRGTLHFNLLESKPWVMGSDRYTPEHWVGSHPALRPCDLSIPMDYWHWQKVRHRPKRDFRFSMWPRRNITWRTYQTPVRDNPDLRIRDYVLLAGFLYRWIDWYNATPPSASWIWDGFPDGQFWKKALEKYGHNVVNIVTAEGFDRNQSVSNSF